MPFEALDAVGLSAALDAYLAEHPCAAVLEDGRVVFDLRLAHYAVRHEHGRCLLQIWSEERNLLRTVTGISRRPQMLRLETRRMGAGKAETLEFVATCDRRTPTAREAGRRSFQRQLERALTRTFIASRTEGFRAAMDLEHSFGPAYVRGRLLRGTAVDAVIGVSAEEDGTTIDGVLTLGLLWLELCRERTEARRHVGTLKVIVPTGHERTTAERMAWLNHAMARFELYSFDPRSEELTVVDVRDNGNLEARLVHAFDAQTVLERTAAGVQTVLALVPPGRQAIVELCPHSSTEVGLLLHGLEFARVRQQTATSSFARTLEMSFGAGRNETRLDENSAPLAQELFAELFRTRHPGGTQQDATYRMQAERWLESELRLQIADRLPGLRGDCMHAQVPAISGTDRGLLDLLTLDRRNRLNVIEVKANEDLHLPLQALDYWMRVRQLNRDRQPDPHRPGVLPLSAFERAGYFSHEPVAEADPRLILIAPALRIHPANEVVLRYLAPQIDWELIAVGEQWRHQLDVIFRKRATNASDDYLLSGARV